MEPLQKKNLIREEISVSDLRGASAPGRKAQAYSSVAVRPKEGSRERKRCEKRARQLRRARQRGSSSSPHSCALVKP